MVVRVERCGRIQGVGEHDNPDNPDRRGNLQSHRGVQRATRWNRGIRRNATGCAGLLIQDLLELETHAGEERKGGPMGLPFLCLRVPSPSAPIAPPPRKRPPRWRMKARLA